MAAPGFSCVIRTGWFYFSVGTDVVKAVIVILLANSVLVSSAVAAESHVLHAADFAGAAGPLSTRMCVPECRTPPVFQLATDNPVYRSLLLW